MQSMDLGHLECGTGQSVVFTNDKITYDDIIFILTCVQINKIMF